MYRQRYEHSQVSVYNPHYRSDINVDEKLVRILLLLWYLNIATDNSCQENKPDITWISFHGDDLGKFLTIIANAGIEAEENEDFEFSASPIDNNYLFNAKKDEMFRVGSPDIYMSISFRFPTRYLIDFEEILSARLEKTNRRICIHCKDVHSTKQFVDGIPDICGFGLEMKHCGGRKGCGQWKVKEDFAKGQYYCRECRKIQRNTSS